MIKKTTFLVSRNSFISGASRIFDIMSMRNKRLHKVSLSDEADKRALLNDWYVIGNDIRGAYDQFKEEIKTQA